MITLSAEQIVHITGGDIFGDKQKTIKDVAKLNEGTNESLGFFANPKYESQLYDSKCGIIFIPENFELTQNIKGTLIKHTNPYYAFCQILTVYFNPNTKKQGIHPQAIIDRSAQIGENAYIGPFVTVGKEAIIGKNAQIHERVSIGDGVIIGDDSTLFPGVTLYNGIHIGHRFTCHSGTVIGSDGFGFAPHNGSYLKIPQVGIVYIEDDVEIGANCCIDRATMGKTIIRKGTKLDNLVQIAHNVEVGEHVVIASQSGFAGSSKIGNHCVFGGQVGAVGHIEIASHNSFGGQAGITSSVLKTHQKMTGTPAVDVNTYLRGVVGSQKIGHLMKEIKELKQEIALLKKDQ
jgi:UDP-3-O-[3-hydroxymyristoyl] glucosamine N-acyltransferase